MDLFAAAGIDVGDGGRGGRSGRAAVARTLRVPLLNYKVVADARGKFTFDPTPQQKSVAAEYAKTVRSARFAKQKETAVRQLFFEKVLGELLGYRQMAAEGEHTLAFEYPIRRGAVDVALGKFGVTDGKDEIVAPFELKGPTTLDLDAIMPGRGRSPVQQAWDYAIDAPGSKWVLVSNCVEIRLYGFGKGRDAFEQFDLGKLDDIDEHARLCLLLSAERLLGGATEALLRQTESAYRDITGKLYQSYSELRTRLIAYLTDEVGGPRHSMLVAIELAQKILDRILFIAFAQRTDLLPDRLLDGAAKYVNRYVPQPIWRNFQGLFRAIDGEPNDLHVWGYNGGLFAPDPAADALTIPDPLATDLATLGEWDYRSEVPVTVLGHIFEQSITDIERLRAEARGEEPPKVSKSKRQGVVYTPEIVTRFLVERTIDVTLDERFAALLVKHGKPPTSRASQTKIFADDEKQSQIAFWNDYLASLRALTIVDPACGSGAFLVAAFELLIREYRGVIELLTTLGETVDVDPYDEIVTKNLYGVDINAESVEITRLALWLKTARNRHRLQNLEATIKVGDSLIDDAKWTERPFDWRAAFPEVFVQGGFDIVIGNPPYVRSELFSRIKPWIKKHYEVYDGGADLYCYFYERGLQLLKDNGRLGFISSCGFFKTAFGARLREYLSSKASLECGVDFGDTRIFEEVTTYPAVLTLRKSTPIEPYNLQFFNYNGNGHDDLSSAFQVESFLFPSQRLVRSRWHFENKVHWQLRNNLEKASQCQLGDIGLPTSGIKTGLTEAFVVSSEVREQLVNSDAKSEEIVRPWMVGDDLAKWSPEKSKEYLLFLPKGWTKATLNESDENKAWLEFRRRYPAVANWLGAFEPKARVRSDKGDFWWELRPCDYYELFNESLVTYPEMSQGPKFGLKDTGVVSNNKTFLVPKSNNALLAFLNSRASWFLLTGICTALRGGQWRLELRADYLKELPIPDLRGLNSQRLHILGNLCVHLASKAQEVKAAFSHRVLTDVAPPGRKKLTNKLEKFWTLDFAAFRAEIKKAFKTDIPVKEREGWENYLNEKSAEVKKLTAEIEAAEREIDAIVYTLFDLTDDEVKLLEASLDGQY